MSLLHLGEQQCSCPRKAFESSAAFSFFIRTNVTTSRFAVRKEGIAGPGTAEGSSAGAARGATGVLGQVLRSLFNLCAQASSPNKPEALGWETTCAWTSVCRGAEPWKRCWVPAFTLFLLAQASPPGATVRRKLSSLSEYFP